jgi:hypothetical protein
MPQTGHGPRHPSFVKEFEPVTRALPWVSLSERPLNPLRAGSCRRPTAAISQRLERSKRCHRTSPRSAPALGEQTEYFEQLVPTPLPDGEFKFFEADDEMVYAREQRPIGGPHVL